MRRIEFFNSIGAEPTFVHLISAAGNPLYLFSRGGAYLLKPLVFALKSACWPSSKNTRSRRFPPLGHMMRQAGNHEAGDAGDGATDSIRAK